MYIALSGVAEARSESVARVSDTSFGGQRSHNFETAFWSLPGANVELEAHLRLVLNVSWVRVDVV